MNKRVFMLFLTIALVHVVVGRAEALKAFDDKLDVKLSIQQTLNIKTHEDVRDIRYNSFRTTFRTEGMYKMVTNDSWNIKWYGLTSYYYDAVLDIESSMRHSIRAEAGGRSNYKKAQRPLGSEEWLKESYVDVGYSDLFTIRLGKQIVSWGETAEEAVADLVNPIDVKYQVAFPDWEDYKLGLWMARIFYTPPNFWQDLVFELIVIPFNFVEQRMPVAGSGFWVGQTTPNDPVDELLTAWRHDAPSETFKNLELGLRIKGFADILEGVDWSLSHFYSRQDAPVVDGGDGWTNFVFSVMGLPHGKVFDYPFYHSTAFSFSTTWSKPGLLIRGETTLNSDKTYHYGTGGPIAPNVKEKDLVTTALTLQRYTMVPFLSGEWNRSSPVSLEVAWYNYWMLDHEYDRTTGEYVMGNTGKDSTKTKFTFQGSAFFMNNQLITNIYGAYDVNGGSLAMARIIFWPTNSWQFIAAYQQFNENYAFPNSRYANQVILSAKLEF